MGGGDIADPALMRCLVELLRELLAQILLDAFKRWSNAKEGIGEKSREESLAEALLP